MGFLIVISAIGLLVTACAGHPAAVSHASTACLRADSGASAFRLGPGDVLHISVWNDKELERTVTVRPDGMISFPLLNDIPASGSTPMQLQDAVTKGLKKYIANPQVSIVVQAVNSFTVSVLGEVNKPGRYEMHSGTATVLDALAMAGGLTPYADRSGIHVMRDSQTGQSQHIPFHYGRAISMRPGQADFCVDPGDIVIVP